MAELRDITVVEVDKENLQQLWPSILFAIKTATYIAIDAELSGLGTKKLLFAKDIDDRYAEMAKVAKTRSVISLGFSCFKLLPTSHQNEASEESGGENRASSSLNFQVQTFNLMVLCCDNYIVEPCSLKFLIEHGFDFNKQYAKGIPYYGGNDKDTDNEHVSLRRLFTEMVLCRVPIVLHNALVDLIFFYQSFYANVPSTMQTFLADLSQIFSGGVYDTKYIAEFKARMSASYLEYVFRKSQRLNSEAMILNRKYVAIECLTYDESLGDIVVILPCALDDHPEESQVGKTQPCESYAAHGWCSKGNNCTFSHDIDIILDSEDKVMTKTQKKRLKKKLKQRMKASDACEKRVKYDENGSHSTENEDMELAEENSIDSPEILSLSNNASLESSGMDVKSNTDSCSITTATDSVLQANNIVRKTGGHRAGFDSFMTGFAFATFICKFGKRSLDSSNCSLDDLGVQDFVNKVALSGKDIPLLIQKGNFAKYSKDHSNKYESINRKFST